MASVSWPACSNSETAGATLRTYTLAPPLTRGLIRLSWILCQILEKINVFNTHYLALIRPNEPHIFA